MRVVNCVVAGVFGLAFGCMPDQEASAATISLTFDTVIPGTIQDATGQGTGLAARLAGTGTSPTFSPNDPNLTLDTAAGTLSIASTDSDLQGGANLATGEYLGTSLPALGFTGTEDFSIRATFLNVAYTRNFDQFGLFVGSSENLSFRGGYIYRDGPELFSGKNVNGTDAPVFSGSLAPAQGDDIVLTFSRTNGAYAFTINNLTTPAASGSLPLGDTSVLDGLSSLVAGVFAANTQNNNSKTAILDSYEVNVVPEPCTLVAVGVGTLGLLLAGRVQRRKAGRSMEAVAGHRRARGLTGSNGRCMRRRDVLA